MSHKFYSILYLLFRIHPDNPKLLWCIIYELQREQSLVFYHRMKFSDLKKFFRRLILEKEGCIPYKYLLVTLEFYFHIVCDRIFKYSISKTSIVKIRWSRIRFIYLKYFILWKIIGMMTNILFFSSFFSYWFQRDDLIYFILKDYRKVMRKI